MTYTGDQLGIMLLYRKIHVGKLKNKTSSKCNEYMAMSTFKDAASTPHPPTDTKHDFVTYHGILF